MFVWRILLICIIQCAVRSVSAAVDATLQPKANGIDVVRAAVLKIRNSCIFPNDYGFLLRVALVESNFGADPNTFRSDAASGGKGIWQINQIGFDDTKNVNSSVLSSVKTKLGVDWSTMTFTSDNMNVPLYNALAARLLLYRKPAAIPSDLTEQAAYWKKYFNTAAGAGTASGFINKVNSIKTCNTVGADLLFILDASGWSAQLMKQMVVNVANKLTIGTNATQIAVLTVILERIDFGSYSAVGPLTSALNNLDDGTRRRRAISASSPGVVDEMFRSARQLDTGFPRVLIDMTYLTDLLFYFMLDTSQAAEHLNAFSWLDRYAVGIGKHEAKLQSIASGCSRAYIIDYNSALRTLTDELYDIACRSSAWLPPPQSGTGYSKMTGTLPPNTPRYARDTAVSLHTGRTYALQVTSGCATLYASLTIENPSSAIHDFSATAKPNEPGVIFVSPSDLAEDLSNSATNGTANSILYLSVVPTEGSGSVEYELLAYDGDHRSLYPTPPMTTLHPATTEFSNTTASVNAKISSKSVMGRFLNLLWRGLSVLIWGEF